MTPQFLAELAPLFTAFSLIFVAELGDKTMLATLLMATKHPPGKVLLGAWLALLVQTGVAMVGGILFAQLPPWIIRWVSVGVFTVFGLALLRDEDEEDEAKEGAGHGPFVITFLAVFAAEWGDATQISTMALVARLHAPWQVFTGALLGLWASAAIAVGVGATVGKKVEPKWLRRAGGVFFLGFALWTALSPATP